jgi:hypothetical protein
MNNLGLGQQWGWTKVDKNDPFKCVDHKYDPLKGAITLISLMTT